MGNGRTISYNFWPDNALEQIQHQGLLGGANATWNFHFNKDNKDNQVNREIIPYQFIWQAAFNKSDRYGVNGLNQYPVINGQSIGYDGNGSLTGDSVWNYQYDVENRLTSATGAGITATYRYDVLGRRHSKNVAGVVSTFLNDGVEEIADYDQSNNLLRRYVHGLGVDEHLVMYTGSGTSNKQYYHSNHQGTTVAMSDQAGNVLDTYSYSPYGEVGVEGYTGNPFRFTGRRLDPETGLYYYRARYYSPALGRFLQTDPVGYGDNLNWYAYVGNDPLNNTDPSGNFACGGFCIGGVLLTLYGAYDTASTIKGAVDDVRSGEKTVGQVAQENAVDVGIGVATTLTGTVALKAGFKIADKIADATRGATETVQRGMSRAELKATQETGLLRGGRDGTHFVSDAVNSTSKRAQQRLALPQGTDVRVTMEVPKGAFSKPSKVKPAFGMPGGGMERTATGKIPVTIKRVDGM